MKDFLRKAAFLCVAVTLLVCSLFAGCGQTDRAEAELLKSDETAVCIRATRTDLNKSVFDGLKQLMEEGKLTFTYSMGDYGAYILTVNGKEPDPSENEFWAVYTSLGEYEGVVYSNSEYGSAEYEGRTLNSASFGVSGLPLVEGEIYLIEIGRY